ncbi:hypothetical protein KIMH_14460 [Bombiscardovia apis]|uniref:RCC1-like domain-containing protein n=1 Tax=Bombiscardovia apis TaxID=2932182 RepID=A0ABM8BEM2_9BIFI|nr:InlB B-repeat-containing protein [Bombiscardovia apis]BDR55335.1 hypothetical protein KIMH_14460 [Bombiscardovia apis]
MGGGATQFTRSAAADSAPDDSPSQLTRGGVTGEETVDGFTLSPTKGLANAPNQASITPPVPPNGVHYTQISTGWGHSLAIGNDGKVYAWGFNVHGEVDPTIVGHVNRPVRVQGLPSNVRFTQVSAGEYHSLALGDDRQVYAWGQNYSGQLGSSTGFGSIAGSGEIVQVSGGDLHVGITQISAGAGHSLALGTDRQIYAWGSNTYGELGNTTGNSAPPNPANIAPKRVTGAGLPRYWDQISAGSGYSLAVGYNNRVYAWGSNKYGTLATPTNSGSTIANPTPHEIPNAVSIFGWSPLTIKAGYISAAVISRDHKVYMWGNNMYGQLGSSVNLGTNTPVTTPTLVSGGALPADIDSIDISSGTHDVNIVSGASTLAIGSDHKVYAWGDNYFGQLGNSTNLRTNTPNPTPTLVSSADLSGNTTHIAAGAGHSIALNNDNHAYTWGLNGYGALGQGIALSVVSPTPGKVLEPVITITGIKFGSTAAVATSQDANTGTWTVDVPQHSIGKVDVSVAWAIDGIAQTPITLHYEYKGTYTVHYDLGEGNGKATGPADQAVMNGEPANWPEDPIWTNHQFTGWFTADGKPWGFINPVNEELTLTAHWNHYTFDISSTIGPTTGNTPVTIQANPKTTSLRFTQVSGGSEYHTLALGSDGNVYAWGWNEYGQLGDGTFFRATRSQPLRVLTPAGVHFLQVSTGLYHSLALGEDHKVYSWGFNFSGELGVANSGRPQPNPTPIKVTSGSLSNAYITQISAANGYSLALDSRGNVHSWGHNRSGQLGNTTNTGENYPNPIPTQVIGGSLTRRNIIQISAGGGTVFALDNTGRVHAWGNNTAGQLGNTDGNGISDSSHPTPTLVTGGSLPDGSITQISAGGSFALALDTTGHVHAWGWNSYGQLGNTNNINLGMMDKTANPTPTPVNTGSLSNATITSISAGGGHSVAIDTQGRLHAWGWNSYGQLGNSINSSVSSETRANPIPVLVTGGSLPADRIIQADAGADYTLAISHDGSGSAWGANYNNQLGDGNSLSSTANPTPRAITSGAIDVSSIEFGDSSHAITPSYNESAKQWNGKSPAHPEGTIAVKMKWSTTGAPQPDYVITPGFRYYTFLTLPAAGTVPLQRFGGSSLLLVTTLATTAYAAYQVGKQGHHPKARHHPHNRQG